MKFRLIALAAVLALSACAKRPDAIAPVDIPMAAYTNLDCQGLAQEFLKEHHNLAALSQQQNQAATGDAVGGADSVERFQELDVVVLRL